MEPDSYEKDITIKISERIDRRLGLIVELGLANSKEHAAKLLIEHGLRYVFEIIDSTKRI